MSSSSYATTATGNRGKILVMDDDEVVRYIAGKTLSRLGFDVEFAEDGAQAIALYRQALESGAPFVAVILDLSIPGRMGGKEAIGKMLELDPHVQAFVSSGYANDPAMVDCHKFGFRGVINKPFLYDDVAAAFAGFLAPAPADGRGERSG